MHQTGWNWHPKELVSGNIATVAHCTECPILQQKLYGHTLTGKPEGLAQGEAGLCCGHCGTTLEAIKMGNPLGCAECYEVFGDLLISELIATGRIPSRLKAAKKSQLVHVGKTPTKAVTISPSSRLTALNEALNEALRKENYEQAAWLRDQINALIEKKPDAKS